ncbi:hypothetical protein D9M68_417540 [compost metagenome]
MYLITSLFDFKAKIFLLSTFATDAFLLKTSIVLEFALSNTNPLMEATGLPFIKSITSCKSITESFAFLFAIRAMPSIAICVILGVMPLSAKILSSPFVNVLDMTTNCVESFFKRSKIAPSVVDTKFTFSGLWL